MNLRVWLTLLGRLGEELVMVLHQLPLPIATLGDIKPLGLGLEKVSTPLRSARDGGRPQLITR